MRPVPKRERGAALLTVLLLVAVMAALAATALERLRLSMALAGNSAALDQARAYAVGVESLMTLTIDDLIARSPERTTLAGGWNGQSRRIPMPGGGIVTAAVRDGGNCFNLNSVARAARPVRSHPPDRHPAVRGPYAGAWLPQGTRLGGFREEAGDWVDSDGDARPPGAGGCSIRPRTVPPRQHAIRRAERACAP
jgi:general secretion pathway protein K